jgi:hypothetical protein
MLLIDVRIIAAIMYPPVLKMTVAYAPSVTSRMKYRAIPEKRNVVALTLYK